MPLKNAIEAPFADDKHDYPSTQPGYGFAGSITEGEVFIKEKSPKKSRYCFTISAFLNLNLMVSF
ncbi:hypothetical protein I6F65_12960 [Pseudoalteromonas sp. SWXJZ94C]|uniref:hypothetical protein n=1 Tax=Pseudoalteromonas sp. SWXJZ94C TaxID=2792065 RepID=UPI0018CD345A|nr:hypothetical protein [Pseudoalteromonas sp. SWXJZ94C]MBH0057876.1 hypothetical protein [Pseudoalteromonas sp. SWXJZ94C]